MNHVQACSQTCKIKDTPAPLLKEYIDQNKKLIQNINVSISKITPPENSLKQQATNIYNQLFNWTDYYTQTEFLKINLTWTIPTPIKRDLELLENQSEVLSTLYKQLIKRWYTYEVLNDICNWVSHCDLDWTVKNIFVSIINNNNNILSFFRLSIMWRQSEFQKPLTLVWPTFTSEMYNYYNKHTLNDCWNCEWESWSTINKMISKASQNFKKWRDGIKDWKDAITLMKWWNTESTNYQERERELLQRELWKQWISWKQWDAILKNLDRYNNTEYSNDNNSVDNSYNRFAQNVDMNNAAKAVTTFMDAIQQIRDQYSQNWEEVESIPLSAISTSTDNVTSSNDIMKELDIIYQSQIPFLAAQDLNSEKLQTRIIKMHIDLSQSINILDATIASAEKVCQDQDAWTWKCRY